jgi:hypothetical protein
LLRSFLNAHSEIAIPTESLFIPDYLRVANQFDLDYLINLIIKEPEISEWGIQVHAEDLEGSNDIGDVIRKLHMLYVLANHKRSWGQKTPRLIRSMTLIGNSFQEARFIHVIRDPRAVVSSLIRSDVHRSNAYHAARRWQMDVEAGLRYEEKNPGRVQRIAYEDLVRHPQETLERITGFLGIPFQSEMLVRDQGTKDYSGFYDNIHANLNKDLSDHHITKWKQTLSNRDIKLIEAMLYEPMTKLGYGASMDRVQVEGTSKTRSKFTRIPGLSLQLIKYIFQRPKYLGYLVYRKWRLGILKDFLWSINY